jgi:TolB protein
MTSIARSCTRVLLGVCAIGCSSSGNNALTQPDTLQNNLIAFGECTSFGVSQIVVAPLDGSARRALTSNPASSWFPAWSPSGDRVAYVYEAFGSMQIWVTDADGRNNHPLTTSGQSIAPSWSRDGTRIAFARFDAPGTGFKIWIMDADGSHAHPLSNATPAQVDENVPRWSPDGSQLVFTSNARGHYEIWTTDVATGGNRRVLTQSYYDAQLNAYIEQKVPAWSPDGSTIAYWAGVEGDDPRPNLPRDVWLMNADGTAQRKLVAGDDPNWSPDGGAIIYSRGFNGPPALGVAARDGSSSHLLFQVQACRSLQSSWR